MHRRASRSIKSLLGPGRLVANSRVVSIRFSSSDADTNSTYEFQAETKKLLDIVAKSLYSEVEIFVRELISNSSDALNKRKFEEMAAGGDPPALEIKLHFDKSNNKLIIEDNGIGMSQQEAMTNLGTIAKSGSQDFMAAVKDENSASAQSIIGQFGVGFYSVFMVADGVDVFTRRWNEDVGLHWRSTGDSGYTIEPKEGLNVGTRIELTLKADSREYADPNHVKKIVQKYSSFTSFPLYCDGEHVNEIEPIWMMEKNEISDEMHNKFYKFLSNGTGDPRFTLYYKTEMPISVRSIFYIPMERPNFTRSSPDENKSEISLYCRKVLISNKTDMILPNWMRFIRGVVDSEDIPLNLSRELLQNTPLISKIRDTLTDRVIKFLNDRAKRQPEEFKKFYAEHKYFISEGIVLEGENAHRRDQIARLLRYESSELGAGEVTSLEEYMYRMKEDQRHIYYLPAKTRQQALASPYLEAIKNKGFEVLFFYDMFDEIVMEQMEKFKEKVPFSIENDIIDDNVDGTNVEDSLKDDDINSDEQDKLTEWAKESLGDLASKVQMTGKLENQPGMITVWNLGVTRNFLRTQRMQNPDDPELFKPEMIAKISEPTLQLSKSHPVIKKLSELRERDETTAKKVLKHIYTSSMVNAGLNEDAVGLARDANELIQELLHKI